MRILLVLVVPCCLVAEDIVEAMPEMEMAVDAPQAQYIPNMIQKFVNGNAGAPDLQQATPMAKQTPCVNTWSMQPAAQGGDAGAASSQLLNHVRYMRWLAPQILFAVESVDGLNPHIIMQPDAQRATAIWRAVGTESSIYAMDFDGGAWGSARTLSTALQQSAPKMAWDASGIGVATWSEFNGEVWAVHAAVNAAGVWSAPLVLQTLDSDGVAAALNVTAAPTDGAVLSWQDADDRVHGISWSAGFFSTPFFLSADGLAATESCTSYAQAFFATAKKVYMTPFNLAEPPVNPVSRVAFLRPIVNTSLACATDPATGYAFLTTQDLKSKFLIGGFYVKDAWRHTTMGILDFNIENIAVAYLSDIPNVIQESVNGNAGASDLQQATPVAKQTMCEHMVDAASCKGEDAGAASSRLLNHVRYRANAVAVWQLSNGAIQATYFMDERWTQVVTLASNGAYPTVAINPTNGHAVAAWADLAAGSNNNAVQFAEFDMHDWSTPTAISNTGNAFGSVQIVMNGAGQALVIWNRAATSDGPAVIEAAASQ